MDAAQQSALPARTPSPCGSTLPPSSTSRLRRTAPVPAELSQRRSSVPGTRCATTASTQVLASLQCTLTWDKCALWHVRDGAQQVACTGRRRVRPAPSVPMVAQEINLFQFQDRDNQGSSEAIWERMQALLLPG